MDFINNFDAFLEKSRSLTGKEFAKFLRVSGATVTRLHQSGRITRNADGTIDLRVAVDDLIEDARQPTLLPEAEESRRALTLFRQERAKIARLERRRMEGELIPLDEVKRKFTDRAHAFARGLDLLARRISLQVAGKSKKTYKRVFEIIETECNALLTVYSRAIPGIHDDNEKTS